MKHQYFRDRRDLFKYDLLLDVLAAVPNLERLTFVPMLTRNDDTGEGRRVALSASRRRPALTAFLSRCHQLIGWCLRRVPWARGRFPYLGWTYA
jgi:hypothetical protein